jgi:hypothetical protein
VQHGKDRGIAADAQSERRQGGQGKALFLPQQLQAEAQVLPHRRMPSQIHTPERGGKSQNVARCQRYQANASYSVSIAGNGITIAPGTSITYAEVLQLIF